jgi:RNA polymerase sigma-70 factor (ECF subfamily)
MTRPEAAMTGKESEALGESLEAQRARLVSRIGRHVDRRLRGRVDAEDVVQDALLEAWRRLPSYLERPTMPLDRWLAFLAWQRLDQLRRRHLGTARRDARREVPLEPRRAVDRRDATPWRIVARIETTRRVREAIDSLAPADREVLVLRRLEGRSNGDVARRLSIGTAAASKRCARALVRLRSLLAS